MSGSASPQDALKREVAELKRLLDEQRQEISSLKERVPDPEEPGRFTGLTRSERRQAMKLIAMGMAAPAALMLATSDTASADAVGADWGTQADPFDKGWFHALAAGDGQQLLSWDSGFDAHSATVSSATTTDGEQFIDGDTSAAGFTITLASADAVEGHRKAIRQNGANDLTIDTEGSENIDGSSTLTLQHDGAVVVLWSDGSNWFSNQFIDTVDARTITTEKATINDLSALMEKTSDQSISANTDTTVGWDSQDVDTDLYTYSTSNDDLQVLEAGDYHAEAKVRWEGIDSAGALIAIKLLINGTVKAESNFIATTTDSQPTPISKTFKDLSANDKIRVDVRSDEANQIDGANARLSYFTVTRSG